MDLTPAVTPGTICLVLLIVFGITLEGIVYTCEPVSGRDEIELMMHWSRTRNTSSVTDHRPLITVKHMGRLGNMMFEYAVLVATARIANKTAVITPAFRSLRNTFNVSLPVCLNRTRLKNMTPFREVAPQLSQTRERLANLSTETSDVQLIGYFQSYTYFNKEFDQLRKEFTFRENIMKTVRGFFANKTGKARNIVRVGIHIRRTDMNTPLKIRQGYGTPPVAYFTKAMQHFKKKYKHVLFIVCKRKQARCRSGDIIVL